VADVYFENKQAVAISSCISVWLLADNARGGFKHVCPKRGSAKSGPHWSKNVWKPYDIFPRCAFNFFGWL